MRTRLLSLMFALVAMLLPSKMWAQTPWAALYVNETDTLLHFTYGSTPAASVTVGGATYTHYDAPTWYWNVYDYNTTNYQVQEYIQLNGLTNTSTPTATEYRMAHFQYPGWIENGLDSVVTKAVFDPSFAAARPKSGEFWFCSRDIANGYRTTSHLKSIEGLEYLNTSEMVSMSAMFAHCGKLTSLDLSHFNTSKVQSFSSMFTNCYNLTSLDVSSFDTRNARDFSGMFQHMCSLTSLTGLSHFDTRNAINLSTMFLCNGNNANISRYIPNEEDRVSHLTSIDVSNFDTRNTTDAHVMFDGCSNLASIDVSNFDTRNMTTMSGMFRGCSKLTSLDVSGFDTRNVASMNDMFRLCSNLTSIDVSNFDTRNVTQMASLFAECKSLTSIDVSNFDTRNVTNMSGMFFRCTSLASVAGLDNFDTRNVVTMKQMFADDVSLTSLDLSSFDTRNVTDMYLMFGTTAGYSGQSSLTTIYAGNDWNTDAVTNSSSMFLRNTNLVGGNGTTFDATKTDKEYARIDKAGEPGYLTAKISYAVYDAGTTTLYLTKRPYGSISTTSFTPEADGASEITSGLTVMNLADADYALSSLLSSNSISAGSITDVVIEPSFKSVRPTTLASWFEGMNQLASITGMAYLNTSDATSMRYMFQNCSTLTSLDLSHFNTSNVTDMGGIFEGCSGLISLNLSNFDTSNVTLMDLMFDGCSALSSINLSSFDTGNVTSMGGMFRGCTSLTSLDLSSFDTRNVISMNGMFRNCGITGALDLSSFQTSKVTLMSNMFAGSADITSIDLALFTLESLTNASGMFNGCTNLETVQVGLTWDASKVTTSTDMFTGCVNIKGGGNNTPYNSSITDKTYARIDNDEHIGYLTEKYPLFIAFYDDRDITGTLAAYGGTSGTVRVFRSFAADEWTTLCLPFSMTSTQVHNVFGSSTELKALSSVVRNGSSVDAVNYSNVTSIEPGKPYLIKPSQAVSDFTLASKFIAATTGANTNTNGFAMRGVLSATTLTTSSTENVYTLVEGQTEVPTYSSTNYSVVDRNTRLGGLRAYFTSMKNNYVTVTVGSKGVGSFSSSYDLDFSDSEVRAYIGVAWRVESSDGATGALSTGRIYDVPAGTGVVIKGTPGTYNVPISKSTVVLANLLVGNTSASKALYQTEGEYTNFYLSSGLFYRANPTKATTVGVGKSYLAIKTADLMAAAPVASSLPGKFRIIFDDEDEESTGIESVDDESLTNADGAWYNLNGQRVEKPTKGIYIKNGKKVFVK